MDKLVHGVRCATLFEELVSEINYAKSSVFPNRSLYEVHGMIKMARQLEAIDLVEYLELNRLCVTLGINNPKYFG